MMSQLRHFTLASYNFYLAFPEGASLPPYLGSTLRGSFGVTFKKVVCTLKNTACDQCLLKNRCIYSYIFETPIENPSEITQKYHYAPHAFVLNPPWNNHRIYRPGSELVFQLTLIGKAIDYLPYFIFTFITLGQQGIGRKSDQGRNRFCLARVTSLNILREETEIYNHHDQRLHNLSSPLQGEDFCPPASEAKAVTLDFLSPVRLVYRGKLVEDLEFHIIFRSLLRRISSLSQFHCGTRLDLDFKSLVARAETIKTSNKQLRWYDWERYSRRQDARMKLGGVLGEIACEGHLTEFMPFITLGQWINVGKGTSFGLGQYKLAKRRSLNG